MSGILKDTEDIDNILKYEELQEFRTKEILDKTDQDIKDFLEIKEIDAVKRKLLFDIFQKLITIYNNMGLQCTISFVLRHKLQILQSDRTITIRTYLIPILGD